MTIVVRRATPDAAAAFARIRGDPAIYPGLLQLPLADEAQWRTRLADTTDPARAGRGRG